MESHSHPRLAHAILIVLAWAILGFFLIFLELSGLEKRIDQLEVSTHDFHPQFNIITTTNFIISTVTNRWPAIDSWMEIEPPEKIDTPIQYFNPNSFKIIDDPDLRVRIITNMPGMNGASNR